MPAPNTNQEFVKLESRKRIYLNPLRCQFKTSNLVAMGHLTIFAAGQTLRILKLRRLFKLTKHYLSASTNPVPQPHTHTHTHTQLHSFCFQSRISFFSNAAILWILGIQRWVRHEKSLSLKDWQPSIGKTENTDTQNMLDTEKSEREVFKATLRHLTHLGVPRGLEYVQEWEVETSQFVISNGN